MKIILYIYLGISILTFIMWTLENISAIHRAKSILTKKGKSDIAGTIGSFIKLIIMSFIPVFNLILLIALMFAGDKIDNEVNKMINETNINMRKE